MGEELDFAAAIESFVQRRLIERLSLAYVSRNQSALRALLGRVRKRTGLARVSVAAVTREDLLDLLTELRARGHSDSSVQHYLAAFRVFFADLLSRNLLLLDPARDLAIRSREQLPRYVPTQQEMRTLLASLDVTAEAGLRDRAIVELLYGSGLRRGELLRLEIGDVDLRERTVFIREGKGQKDRAVPLTQAAAGWMGEYLKIRPHSASSGSARFFLGVRGNPLEKTTFHVRFKALVRRAGLPAQLSLHSLRHACALHLLEGGADLVAIKNLLGHRRIDTTAVYLRMTVGHLARALSRSHPRG